MNRQVIFDTVKRLLGRGFTQTEVNQIDAAIDAMVTGGDVPTPTSALRRMKVSKAGVDFIHSFESLKLKAYPDPGSGGAPWTIGWGSTTDLNGKPIKPGTVWTKDMADEKFTQDLAKFEEDVNRLIGDAPTTQNQFDALVSFAYNLGIGNLEKSTLLKHHLAGRYASAENEFVKWNKASGKVMNGLTRRRLAEKDIYEG